MDASDGGTFTLFSWLSFTIMRLDTSCGKRGWHGWGYSTASGGWPYLHLSLVLDPHRSCHTQGEHSQRRRQSRRRSSHVATLPH